MTNAAADEAPKGLPPRPVSAPFLKPMPLPDLANVRLPDLDWNATGNIPRSTVTMRYSGSINGKHVRAQQSVGPRIGYFDETADVKGTFLEAVKAAQAFSTFSDDPGSHSISSTSIIQAKEGVYTLVRNMFTDGLGDGMDAIISLPVDPIVQKDVDNSLAWYGDTPPVTRVRINDPAVLAVVGRDNWVKPGA